jgi:exonuclease SbcC
MIRLKRLYAHNFKQLQDIELHFPDHARILVQGKNEAGKSTLFEAVFFALFGTALATETGARNLDDLIRYDVEKARVELDVQMGARLFKIVRSIVRGKQNVWELDIVRAADDAEEIRGNTVVNKRLVAELGFDGDALLNTCFVEQKKLEKLEGLSKAKREESLAKLLNLDALVQIESELKITAEDKRELDRLKKRADLAAIQADLPPLQAQLAETEKQLRLIDLRGAVSGTLAELRAVQQLDATIQTLARERENVAQRVERIEALKQAMLDVKAARDTIERHLDNAREIERLQQEQSEIQRAIGEIPNLKNQIARLDWLAHRLARLEQVSAARERYAQRAAQIASIEARLIELDASAAREEAALAQIETRLHEYAIGETLGEWIAAQREIGVIAPAEEEVRAQQRARDQLAQQFKLQIFGLVAVLLVFWIAGAIVSSAALIFFVLAVLVGIGLAMRATMLWREMSRAVEELGRVKEQAQARASASEAQQACVREIQERLTQLGATIPETIEVAQARRVIIAREMNNQSLDDLRAEQDATRARLLDARAVRGELRRQNALDETSDLSAERARCEHLAQKAEQLWTRWHSRAQTIAQSLQIELDAKVVQRARFQLQAQVDQLQKRANEMNRLTQEIARREQQTQTLLAQARDLYERARAVQADAPTWSPALELNGYNGFGKALRAEYDVLGGDALFKQARELEGALGRRYGERTTRQQNVEMLYARVQELIGANSPLSALPEVAELESLAARLSQLDLGDEATLRAQQRELVGRVRSLSDRQALLERELGLQGQALDRAECQREWEQKVRELMVRERGIEIAAVARRRIVQRILPATMDYMRRILPTLTRDRYHDAQLDPETYKIQVWDERVANGGAFKEKNIFSGGTKDQFSLALRLAFALATLPAERGAAPSFIFLDEPLGSFDDERADALIYLLTEGEIARAFDQIFLISHVHVNERLFTHRVVLENGRVAETDLPGQ